MGMRLQGDPRRSWRQAVGDSPCPVLGYVLCPPFSQWELCSRMQPSESNVLLRWFGLDTWLNPGEASIQTFKVWWLMWRFTHLGSPSPVHEFPGLLNLPPPNLERPASFWVSPCFSYMGASFKFHLGNYHGDPALIKLQLDLIAPWDQRFHHMWDPMQHTCILWP